MKKLSFLILFSIILFSGCGVNGEVEIETLEVEKQDQTTQNLELYLSSHISNITLTSNLTLGEKTFNINSLVAPQVGNLLCLKDIDGNIFTQDKIKSVTSLGGNLYEVSIYSGVEYAFSTDDGCSIRSSNMAVDGSIDSIKFSVSPMGLNKNVEWDLTRIICISSGDGVGASNEKPDLTSLFTTSATTRGILFRMENTNYYKNLFYVLSNNDFVLSSFDYEIQDANRLGEYGFTFRKTVNGDDKSGVIIRLSADPSSNMYHSFNAYVERDLTDVSLIECKLMGHETDKYAEGLI